MKATVFAEFFDLWVELMTEEIANEYKDYEDYEPTKYIVLDINGYYTPWFIDDVSKLVWCVDSMVDDYVIYDLEDWYGFEPTDDEKTLYEEAADWATERNIPYADILRVIAGYEDIEDDVA